MASPYASVSDSLPPGRYAGEAAQPSRETREVEALLESARRLNDIAAKAYARTNDMKVRLLGLSDPQSVGNNKEVAKIVPCELTDLRQNLGSLEMWLDKLHENITALERV